MGKNTAHTFLDSSKNYKLYDEENRAVETKREKEFIPITTRWNLLSGSVMRKPRQRRQLTAELRKVRPQRQPPKRQLVERGSAYADK